MDAMLVGIGIAAGAGVTVTAAAAFLHVSGRLDALAVAFANLAQRTQDIEDRLDGDSDEGKEPATMIRDRVAAAQDELDEARAIAKAHGYTFNVTLRATTTGRDEKEMDIKLPRAASETPTVILAPPMIDVLSGDTLPPVARIERGSSGGARIRF